MENPQVYQQVKAKLGDREWRLSNLYYILDKNGNKEKLKLNIFQKLLYKYLWYLNIILKARQLGLSTFIVIFILDACLFNSNRTGGIIDATLPDAKKKLEKVRFAYNNLPDWLKNDIKLIKDNEQELRFSNGSSITADTTFRGATIQYLHISEYAKVCKTDPIRAREIKTGALNAITMGQFVFIESTAEDGEGNFYDMCQRAEKLYIEDAELTELDYRFHFFPWYLQEEYSLIPPEDFVFSHESVKYFNSLENQGIKINELQKFWYVKKREEQGEEMKKEYPSTSKEAFEAATDDKYYKEIILKLRGQNQVCEFPIEKGVEIDLDLDLGRSDYTSIIFSQTIGKELRIVDFIEGNGEHISFFIEEIKKKGYLIGKIWLPHDSKNELLSSEKTNYNHMCDAFGRNHVDVVDKLSVEVGINEVRKLLHKCWFRRSATELLLEHLEKHSKKWNIAIGQYTGEKESKHIHAADAFRGLAVRYNDPKPKGVKKDKPVPSMLKQHKRF